MKQILFLVLFSLFGFNREDPYEENRKISSQEAIYVVSGNGQKNPWGRIEENGLIRYKNMPVDFCPYFFGSMETFAIAKGKKVEIYIEKENVSYTQQDFAKKITLACFQGDLIQIKRVVENIP